MKTYTSYFISAGASIEDLVGSIGHNGGAEVSGGFAGIVVDRIGVVVTKVEKGGVRKGL